MRFAQSTAAGHLRVQLTPARQVRLGGLTAWTTAALIAVVMLASARPAQARDMKPEKLEEVKQATVMVFTAASKQSKGDTKMGSGSGYFINRNGLMITNDHVIDPMHGRSKEEKARFHYETGRLTWTVIVDSGTDDEKEYEAMVLYQNESADNAILQVYDEDGERFESPSYLRFLAPNRLREGMKAYALGFPGGDRQHTRQGKHPEVSVTVGHVLQIPYSPAGRIKMIYTDVIARPGNSGGPMVDVDGMLLGTVTLQAAPKGREDTGGATQSALSPVTITRDMVRYAYLLGKIPAGTDFRPFVGLMADESGQITIPGYERQRDSDILFFEDGDRIYGDVATDTITWVSDIGTFEVPTNAVAYVLSDEDESNLFLEGGNRIAAAEVGATFQFTAKGGGVTEQDFDEVGIVGFRTSGRRVQPVQGEIITLSSGQAHLILTDIKGKAKLKGKAGTIELELSEIDRFELSDDEEQVVIMKDGRRMTGEFTDDPITATIAATRTPITFTLGAIESGTVDVLYHDKKKVGGYGYFEILARADKQVRGILKLLASDEVGTAQKRIDALLAPASYKTLSHVKRDQIKLLNGLTLLRGGRYGESNKAFRKCVKAVDDNIGAYAEGILAVFKEYSRYEYNGKPLSDRVVFVAAGKNLGWRLIHKTRDVLSDARKAEQESSDLDDSLNLKKTDYTRAINTVRTHSKKMRIASVLCGLQGDDELIRLYQYGQRSCENELARIRRERQEMRQDRQNPNARKLERDLEKLAKHEEKVNERLVEFDFDLDDAGFRIEDPDIQKRRDRGEDEHEDDGP